MWQCFAIGLPEPIKEHPFCGIDGKRKWRFDLAWPDKMIAVEIDGGVYTAGRHTRGTGYINDREKDCEATVKGWRILRITKELIANGKAAEWIEMLCQEKAK